MTQTPERRLGRFALGAILAAEGYGSLSIEMLALRQMAPWAGTSIGVTAVLLAVYLAALAGGYAHGGRVASATTDTRDALAWRLAAAAALASWWLHEAALTLVFVLLPGPPIAQVAVYSVVGIAPIAWLLAESVLIAHAAANDPDASRRAGGVFALSTAGNVAGALATTFVLMQWLGTAAAGAAVCATLLLATAAARPRRWPATAIAIAATLPIASLWAAGQTYVKQNTYANYEIVDDEEHGRILVTNGNASSRERGDGEGWNYIEAIERAACGAGEVRILAIGAAGQTFGRGAPCRLETTFVDIDPDQAAIAEQFLGEPPGRPLIARDGRRFLREDERLWDAIVHDAMTGAQAAPGHLITHEFLRLARSRLTDDGTFYMNVITRPQLGRYQARIDRTLRSVFADCETETTDLTGTVPWHERGTRVANRVYRCRKTSDDGDRRIYSDATPAMDLDRIVR